jgi:hypothetical protein
MSMNTLTETQHTLMNTLMNILTGMHMNTLTNMITPVHRMSMTMITLRNTDCMIMIIPGTKQKNIHTIIKQELSNPIVIHGMGLLCMNARPALRPLLT